MEGTWISFVSMLTTTLKLHYQYYNVNVKKNRLQNVMSHKILFKVFITIQYKSSEISRCSTKNSKSPVI